MTEIIQNWNTIWLDRRQHLAASTTISTIHLSLCKIDPYLVTFRDVDKCIDYIVNMKDDENKVILIISNHSAYQCPRTLIQQSEELSIID